MLLTNSSPQMILSITHTHEHWHTHATLCLSDPRNGITEGLVLHHSQCRCKCVYTKAQPPTQTHAHISSQHGCLSLEQESFSLSQRLLLLRPSDSGYISSLPVCAHVSMRVCVCVPECVCTFECICVSSLIALTPASVKWDSLPLSVFKSRAERAEWLKWTDGSCRLPVRWACLL